MSKYYYITKYALSEGISYEECTEMPSGEYVSAKPFLQLFRIGIDAFENFDDAHKRAVEMRNKRIKSFKKQLARLEKLRFVDAGKDNG
jgi:hypothetical protein